MTIKIAINGYGRIGRNVLRAHYEGGKKTRHRDRCHQRPGRAWAELGVDVVMECTG